jgi:hypothetical protein
MRHSATIPAARPVGDRGRNRQGPGGLMLEAHPTGRLSTYPKGSRGPRIPHRLDSRDRPTMRKRCQPAIGPRRRPRAQSRDPSVGSPIRPCTCRISLVSPLSLGTPCRRDVGFGAPPVPPTTLSRGALIGYLPRPPAPQGRNLGIPRDKAPWPVRHVRPRPRHFIEPLRGGSDRSPRRVLSTGRGRPTQRR